MFKTFLKVAAAIVFIIILNFCGQKNYSLDEVKGIIKTVNDNLHGLKEKDYEWASKKAYSKIKAFYPLKGYTLLNERIRFRSGGDSFNLYYFKDGNLVFFKERKLTFKKTYRNKLRRVLSSLDLYLDQYGNVVGLENMADKKKADLEGSQVTDILSHANEIYAISNPKKKN